MSEAVAKGKEYIAKKMPWRIMRYYFYAVVTGIALILPWIQVNGNHFFLLSFDKLKLHLAFVQFDMQEMYLMPFLLMIMFIGIFGLTVLGGRVFCGWMCPQTIFRVVYRDLIETKLLKLHKRIKNKQQKPDMSKMENKVKKTLAVLIWTVLAFIAAADLIWYFVSPYDFIDYMMNPGDHMILVGTILTTVAFLVYDIVFLKEDFCIYVCPYSRIQSVLYDDDTVMAIYDPHRGGEIYNNNKEKMFTKQKDLQAVESAAECTTCESCVTVCPTHIDIRQGLQLECINCLECVDACTTVMGALGKPSLVRWSSEKEALRHEGKTNFMRGKVIAYATVLLIVLISLFAMGSKKEHMLLNVNKTTRLYKILDQGVVQNSYLFLFTNTDSKEHTYFFEIVDNDKIKIVRPKEPFKIGAGKKKKKVVIFETNEELANDARKDVPIPVTLRAYATDDKEKIVVDRKTVFVYPRIDLVKK